jgi:integrase
MKLSEATNIKWGEMDFERDHFVVSGGEVGYKNRQIRTVPLFPAMRKFLEDILTSMKCPEINIYLNLSLREPLWKRQVALPVFLASRIIA